jgi:hypothetical protein
MAPTKNDRQVAARRTNSWSGLASNPGSLGPDVRNSPESGYIVVVVLLMLLFCLLLPVMTLMYFDILKVQKQAERTEARIEKVLKNLEEKDKK